MQRLPIDLKDLRVLVTVANEGSFAAAARVLDMSRLDVSRCIARIEHLSNIILFVRSTRSLRTTLAAEQLMARITPALETLESAFADIRSRESTMSGLIRLSCSHAFARRMVMPLITRFQELNPNIKIQFTLQDVVEDHIGKQLDLSIRIGEVGSDTMIARKLGDVSLCLAAVPAIMADFQFTNLNQYKTVGFRPAGGKSPFRWKLQEGDRWIDIGPSQPSLEVDSIDALFDLACCGAGIACLPRYMAQDALAIGKLKEAKLPGQLLGPPVFLCFKSRNAMPPRVRALCDFLIDTLPPLLR